MEEYQRVHQLGTGACGSVDLVRNLKYKKLYALKKIQLDEKRRNRMKSAVLKEAKILAELKHPNIVAYHDSFFDDSETFLYIVQDYCDGGTLDEKIQEIARKGEVFTERQVIRWFIQLTMAVQYMHSKRILHRDLKPQNVFMNKSGTTCKLGDFGISKMMEATLDLASTCVGTPCYLAPEMCQDIPYNSKADVWALGCLLYEMLTLRPAFEANNLISLFYKIIKEEVKPIPEGTYSEKMRDLTLTVLNKNPDERPSARQILLLPFVKEHLAEFIVELMTVNTQREAASPDKASARRRREASSPEKAPPGRRTENIPGGSEPSTQLELENKDFSVRTSDRRVKSARTDSRPTVADQLWERQRLSQTLDSAVKLAVPQTALTPRKTPGNITARKEGKLECLLCGKKFSKGFFLKQHIKKSHEGPPVSSAPSLDEPDGSSSKPEEAAILDERLAGRGQQEPDYEDDFERESSDSDVENEICEDDWSDNKDSEIEEELSQGSGVDTDTDYPDDFEPYDSDDDLCGMMQHAREAQDGGGVSCDEDFVEDEEAVGEGGGGGGGFFRNYKGLIQQLADMHA